MSKQKTFVVAQLYIQAPGYFSVSAELEHVVGRPLTLEDIAIQTHELVNDLVMDIRARGLKSAPRSTDAPHDQI